MTSKFITLMHDNPIVGAVLEGKTIDTEIYEWTGGDILRLTYIQSALEKGQPIEEVAKFYGVDAAGIKKYILKET